MNLLKKYLLYVSIAMALLPCTLHAQNKPKPPSGYRRIEPSGMRPSIPQSGVTPSGSKSAAQPEKNIVSIDRLSVGIEISSKTWKVSEYDNTWDDSFTAPESSDWAGRDADIKSYFLTTRYAVTPDIGASLRLGLMKGGDNDVNLRPGSGIYSFEAALGIAIDVRLVKLEEYDVDVFSRFELTRGETSEWRRNDDWIYSGDIEEWRLELIGIRHYTTTYGDFLLQGGLWYGEIHLPYTHESTVPGLPREGGFESDKNLGFVLGMGMHLNSQLKAMLEIDGGAASGFKISLMYDL